MLPIYVTLFNVVFETAILSEAWIVGNILPIYKNKGNDNLPENYRPITLLSCMGKLFTSILSKRLNTYADQQNILNENQGGFRSNYSTIDNIFTLHSLIELSSMLKKKMYCAFIDFRAAFDNVWRVGLWQKLIQNGITGKCFDVIVKMYSECKSRIAVNNNFSAYFPCRIGVRQGENLSPFLFALFLNDEVNIEKTKIVIFTKGRVKNNVFYYNGKEIEIVKNFKYLGVIFSSSGSFIQTNALLRLVKTGSRGKKQNGSMSDNRKFIG